LTAHLSGIRLVIRPGGEEESEGFFESDNPSDLRWMKIGYQPPFTSSGSDWSSDQEDEKSSSGLFKFDNPSDPEDSPEKG
jgi:hypothetical protein